MKIVMLASPRLEAMTERCIESIYHCGISKEVITVYAPRGFKSDENIHHVSLEDLPNEAMGVEYFSQYSEFQTSGFCEFTFNKWVAIEHAISTTQDIVIFTDVDMVWLKSPIDYLRNVLGHHDLAIQSEAKSTYPAEVCTGFMAFNSVDRNLELLMELRHHHASAIENGLRWNDQTAMNFLYQQRLHKNDSIHVLSETAFPVGKLASLMQPLPDKIQALLWGKPEPFIYHANWVVGLQNKELLLDYVISGTKSQRVLCNAKQTDCLGPEDQVQGNRLPTAQTSKERNVRPPFASQEATAVIFESTPSTPHVETGLEIALRASEFCKEVIYAPVYTSLSAWESFLNTQPLEVLQKKLAILANSQLVLSGSQAKILAYDPMSDCFGIPEFESLEHLSSISYDDFPVGRYVCSTMSFFLRTSTIDLSNPENQRLAKLLLQIGYESFATSLRVLSSVHPDIAFLYNGRFVTTAASKWACKATGVRHIVHERGSTHNKFTLAEDSIHNIQKRKNDYMRYAAGTLDITRAFRAHHFFAQRRAGQSANWVSFTSKQRAGMISDYAKQGKSRKLVVYYVSSDDEISFLNQNLDSGLGDQIGAFLTLKNLCSQLDIALSVRIHPHYCTKSGNDLEFWLSQRGPLVEVIPPDSPIDSYSQADSADIIVTFMSTMGIEGAYWMKPTILLGNAFYDEPAIMKPKTTQELLHYLKNPVDPQTRLGAEAYGYFMDDDGIPFLHFKPEPRDLFGGSIKGIHVMNTEG